MIDITLETLIDTLKLIPFLFVAFLIMEYIEHKLENSGKEKITKSGKLGPIIGSLLGAVPQCGFAVSATNLYATRIISLGTLISIYLSTSDEMLPILIGEGADFKIILTILLTKIIIGIIAGFIIDFILRKKNKSNYEIHDFCHEEHCDCEHSLFKSAVKHTLSITLFIFLVSLVLHIGLHYLGEDTISKLLLKDTFFSPFLSSMIGLIPNCASSVIITELFLNNTISFASCISGLLTGSGVAIVVLFKQNKNLKENLQILLTLYLIGSLSGIFIEILLFLL